MVARRTLLPPAQPYHHRARVIPFLRHRARKVNDRLGRLVRRPAVPDDIHDLLIAQRPTHAVGQQHQEAKLALIPHRQATHLRLRADAESFLPHVAECAGVSEHAEALFAERVRDECGGVATQALSFGRE
ncbi:hypothetical protein ABW21_db0209427 [Orbilia brochopaga]|nr:hypothetical protein ABW21_db0209427 [Drechslerella brochopaga]